MKDLSKFEKVLALASAPPFSITLPPLLLVLIVEFLGGPGDASGLGGVLFSLVFFGSYALSYFLGKYSSKIYFKMDINYWRDRFWRD